MALTPEDVVNKRFQPTKFREGYDQDEVDDFLDEVVVELRRLGQENEELKQRLVASDSRIAELQRSGGQSAQTPAEQPSAPIEAAPVAAAAVAAPVSYAAPAAAAVEDANDPASTNSLLQLARRLHEEHVREGAEKRDALIAEGHATAARVVAEAESKQRAQINSLDQERSELERRIDELRTFERDYRQKLKGYIEGQLRELDSTSVAVASPSTGSHGTTPSAAQPASGQIPAQNANSGQIPTAIPAAPASSDNDGATQPPTFQGFGG